MPNQSRLPQETRAVVVKQSAPDRIPLRHDAALITKPIPPLKDGEVLIKMTAAAFNHREVDLYLLSLAVHIYRCLYSCGLEWGYTQRLLLGVHSGQTAPVSCVSRGLCTSIFSLPRLNAFYRNCDCFEQSRRYTLERTRVLDSLSWMGR